MKFLIALQFLTIFPINIKKEIKKEDFGKSFLYFPLVGLLIGLFLVLSAFLFSFLPEFISASFVLLVSIIITGGLHIDGLADTCDGFYGNRSKEKILEIMRDSNVGAMGAIGIVILLLMKFSFISSICDIELYKILIAITVFSRWAQSLVCCLSSYVRKEGKAKYFIDYVRKKDVIAGGIFTLILFLLLMKIKGLILFFLSTLIVFLFLLYIKKKIGGITGDIIGAISEVSEITVFLIFFILDFSI